MVAEVYRNFRKNQELMLQEYHWVGFLEYHKIVIHPENRLTIDITKDLSEMNVTLIWLFAVIEE